MKINKGKKAAIARANGKKSKGPVTDKGKMIVSKNGIKHGFFVKEFVIDKGRGKENVSEFDSLIDQMTKDFTPDSFIEKILIEKIAVSLWRLRRIYKYEKGLIRKYCDNGELYFQSQSPKFENPYATEKYSYEEMKEQIEYLPEYIKEVEYSLEELKKVNADIFKFLEMNPGIIPDDIIEPEDFNLYDDFFIINWLYEFIYDKDICKVDTVEKVMENMLELNEVLKERSEKAYFIINNRIAYHTEELEKFKHDVEMLDLQKDNIKNLQTLSSLETHAKLNSYEKSIEKSLYQDLEELRKIQVHRRLKKLEGN